MARNQKGTTGTARGLPRGSDAADRLLSITEVARITGRPPAVVSRWVHQGLLTTTRGADASDRIPLASLLALAREDFEGAPLYRQLRSARLRRGLSQAALAELFGTSQRMVAFWERGPEPSGQGTPPGKPIAPRYLSLIQRWIATGQIPTVDELGPAERWERSFARLQQFVQREGHAQVPITRRGKDATLGSWVSKQRTCHAKGVLSADRGARLDALPGWSWDRNADGFLSAIRVLQSFVAQAGNARVPTDYRSADGFALGNWCAKQRTAHRRGLLSPERAALLEALPGWSWEPRLGRPRVRRR